MTVELAVIILIVAVIGIIVLLARVNTPKQDYDGAVLSCINNTETYIDYGQVAQVVKEEEEFYEESKF